MDDLVFKNIPAEGFDPQTGFSDRVSNPTPSRSGGTSMVSQDDRLSNPSVRSDDAGKSLSDEFIRMSNPASSQRADADADLFSRASNPTPTRRGAKSTSPFDTDMPVTSSSPESVVVDDPYSRASNPTPTRRRGSNAEVPETDTALFGVVPGVDISRASNPTPRRRGSEAPFSQISSDETFIRTSEFPLERKKSSAAAENPPSIDEEPSLSFASVTDPYGAGLTEDSRASNPTPTRRIFGFDEAPSDDEYDDSNRLSNISQSSRK